MKQKIIILLLLVAIRAGAQINIWEHDTHHKSVMMMPYRAVGGNGTAVVVCPGGSYFWHDKEGEASDVGQWLQENGITAFVLNYRTAKALAYATHYRLIFRGTRYPDAQDDLRQAIRYVKEHAEEYGVDTTRIGAMGFSAGGHLVMSAAELFDAVDRPAFVVPVYPVVTMTEECVHKRSRRGLLGDSRTGNEALRDQLSLERHVPTDCPPVFLVNCVDDPVVDYRNSVLLDSALTAAGVNHRYVQFQTGGHGFGASERKGTAECRQWKQMFLEWIKNYDK